MTIGMNFIITFEASSTTVNEYLAEVRYADKTFANFSPLHSQTITIDSYTDEPNGIFESLEAAKIYMQQFITVNDLNTFFGGTVFHLANIITTDTGTLTQIEDNLNTLNVALGYALGAKLSEEDFPTRLNYYLGFDFVQALADLPVPGEFDKVYFVVANGKRYLWNGTSYDWINTPGMVTRVNNQAGMVTLTQDDIGDGTTNKAFTTTMETKLSGIEDGATVNDTDANLKNRSNHTGTQAATTITGLAAVATSGSYADLSGKPSIPTTFDDLTAGTTNKAFTDTEKTKLSGIASGATANSSDATLLARANHTGTQSADTVTDGTINKVFTATMSTKLAGIATGATANDTDANLKARANHTGTQAISTVTGLQTALDQKPIVYRGATQKTNAKIFTSSTSVSSGVATFYLTDNGASNGNPLFTNVYEESINCFVSDATASYQMAAALTNSNKTLTITANKLTTANILTGVLGQTSANGSTVRLTVWGD